MTGTESHSLKHDVFLSFRGEDTRTGFTDHLYHALHQKAIDTFRDNEGLERGEAVWPGIKMGIQESRFAIVVLSEKYATSSWCLKEVAKIVKYCNLDRRRTIIPVFYHVEPNHVRNQTGTFGEPFTGKHKYQNMDTVNKWRNALTQVADIEPRWELKQGRHESDVIQDIVNKIFKDLYERASKDLVGMDSRIKKIQSLVDECPSDDVCTIGIWGMGGIGKTTLARGIFQSMFDKFEASAFIGNVREEYDKNGMVHLQKRLHKILLNDDEGIHDDHMVTNILSQRLRSKKVLIILDDVDKLEQIASLIGNWKNHYDWLGRGSRVIVTTRDKHLVMNYGQDYIYKVDKLNDDEALELLHQRAFDKNGDLNKYRELSIQVVEYANGHPLTLEVLSPYLKGKTVDEWSNILDELKKHPNDEPVHRTLQLSYDGLDKWEKKIFLDIACFFKGEDLYRVKKILDSCRFHPTIGVKVLIEKCFITIASDRVWMHDLLQEFGHEIVRQESIMLGKRSRLWNHKDARYVLENYEGTKAVQGIFLNLPENEELQLSEEKKMLEMKRLRLLKIHNVRNFSECGYLSNELRVLDWHQYPLIHMPSIFQPKNLVELNMSNSRIERLWDQETTLSLEKLILLNLSNCEYLVDTPDFSRVPNLERLILEGCKRLSKIHPTIEKLKQLMLLNLKGCESIDSLPEGICFNFLETFILTGCKKLDRFPEIVGDISHLSQLYLDGTAIKELPTSAERLSSLISLDLTDCKNLLCLPDFICSFTSLENLNISGCSLIDQLPENIGSLEKLEKLDACRTAIRKAPSSIVLLKNLKTLCFAQCGGVADGSSSQCSSESNIGFQLPKSFSGLSSLTCLSLAECNLEEGAIPEDIGCLTLLERLELSGNNFISLPDSISQLSNLRRFTLDNCSKLRSLPKLPLNVKHVQAHDCPMLKDKMTIWPSDEGFSFIDCRKSVKAEGCLTHHSLPMPEEHIPTLFPKFIQDQIYHGGNLELRFPCARIPDWCIHLSSGSSKRIGLPEKDSSETWLGFALFVVFLIKKQENFHDGWYNTFCEFYTDEGCLENPLEIESFNGFKVGSYGLCVYVPKTRFGNQLDRASHIEVSISTDRSDVEVLECGLHVIYDKDVAKFTQDLVDTSNEHLSLTSIKHYKHILEKASALERSRDVLEVQPDSSPRKQVFGTLHPTSQLKRDLQSLLSTMVQGCYASKYHFFFGFSLKGFQTCWFFHQSVGRMVVCYIPPDLFDNKSWIGFSLYVKLKGHLCDLLNNDNDSVTPHSLYIDLHMHGSSVSHVAMVTLPVDAKYSNQLLLFHAPRQYFKEELNHCWEVSALFRTSNPDVEVEICGIRVVYEQDLGDLIQMISECAMSGPNDEHHHRLCYQAYRKAVEGFLSAIESGEPEIMREEIYKNLEKISESERSIDVNELESDPSFINQVLGTLHPSRQLRIDLKALLSRIFFEGSLYTRNLPIPFSFPITGFATGWFFHQSAGCNVVCYLPANILDDKSWIGFSLYATLKMSPSDLAKNYSDSKTARPLLHIDLHSHGSSISHVKTLDNLPIMPYSQQLFLFHVPRVYFKEYQLNRCWGVSASFRTSIPNVEVERCGIRAIFEKDLGHVVEMITECQLGCADDQQLCYQAYEMLVESIIDRFQFVKPETMEQETPIHSSYSSQREDESLQTNMFVLSAQHVDKEVSTAYEQITIPRDPIVVHFKREFMESSYKMFEERSSGDTKLGLIHLQIMAETPLFENDLTRWKRNLEDIFELHISFYVFITLSLKGHIISVLKPFDPFSTYNLCFPRKEILEWFGDYRISERTMGIGLPPNLKTDKDWRGIAICAAFSVQEHPNAILDDENLHVPFRLLCHLSTDQECCLNPAPMFRIAKDKFKWSYIRGFIWLTYIPSSLLFAELHGQSHIAIDIYNECPGLITKNLGVRLLFKEDVEEFRQSITKCMTGFFDNLNPIYQFMANESDQKNHSHVDHEPGSKSSTGKSNWSLIKT